MIEIYTDGSCITAKNKAFNVGAWVAVIFMDPDKIILKGMVENTTHNRMELLAVIESLKYLTDRQETPQKINIYTDSQYVAELEKRGERLKKQNFISGKNKPIQNADLVKILLDLIEKLKPQFIKVKAHQKKSAEENFNREADLLVRKIAREYLKAL
jgi:ribonuclease HI